MTDLLRYAHRLARKGGYRCVLEGDRIAFRATRADDAEVGIALLAASATRASLNNLDWSIRRGMAA